MLEKEYKYYRDNEKDLIEKYFDKHIVIKNDKIIGVYDSLDDAITNSLINNELGTFLVKHVEREERVLRFFNRVFA